MGSYKDTSGGSADLSGPFNLVTDDMYYVFSWMCSCMCVWLEERGDVWVHGERIRR